VCTLLPIGIQAQGSLTGTTGMQADQGTLEAKNHELIDAFREKSRAQQQLQKLYQSLKAQVMASHVANAAGDEAEYALQHTVRGDRFVDKLPGARTGTGTFSQPNLANRQGGRQRYYNRDGSNSSGSSGQPKAGGIGLGPVGNSQSHGYGLGARGYTGRKSRRLPRIVHGLRIDVPIESAPGATPSQAQPRGRLPVLGGTRANAYMAPEAGPAYQPSPANRQPFGVGPRNLGGFGLGTKASKKR
jgi:hypothetical protein